MRTLKIDGIFFVSKLVNITYFFSRNLLDIKEVRSTALNILAFKMSVHRDSTWPKLANNN